MGSKVTKHNNGDGTGTKTTHVSHSNGSSTTTTHHTKHSQIFGDLTAGVKSVVKTDKNGNSKRVK